MQETGFVTSRDGTAIGYTKLGSGPTLLLVDGALRHRGFMSMTPLAEALAGDFEVVFYDRRARGESVETRPYTAGCEIDDIAALIEGRAGPVHLYGMSSGAVLALLAAASGAIPVARLALLAPPFGGDGEADKQEHAAGRREIETLLAEGRPADALASFLGGMMPPEMLDGLKASPDWPAMVAVAPTIAHEYAILGDGAVPKALAASVAIPTLVLNGGDNPPFNAEAAEVLAGAMPDAVLKTVPGETTMMGADVLAPILKDFLLGSSADR